MPNRALSLVPLNPNTYFERHLRRDGALIECRCRRCGFRFIGSVSKSLATFEGIHSFICHKKKLPRSGLRIV
jgi:hypothetical protein